MRVLALAVFIIATLSVAPVPALALPDHNPPRVPSLMASEHDDPGRTPVSIALHVHRMTVSS